MDITLGTVTRGVWNGTAIADAYVAKVLTGMSINGVTPTTGGSTSSFLNASGAYSTPAGSGTVTSITADATLIGGTITSSGTIGLDLTHANSWSGVQTFLSPALAGIGAGVANLLYGNTGTTSNVTFPTGTYTLVGVGVTQTLTNKTLTSPVIANIAPGADFTLTQNSVVPFTSVNSGAIVNTLVLKTGLVGIGTTAPTALLHLKAGTATANTGPLKFTSGTLLTTTEAGSVEYNGSHLYFSAANSGTRFQLDQQVTAGSFSGVGTATTTFTVTIGITMANSTYKVNATPTDLLAAAVFYVNNKTTTTFDVVYLAGLTGTVTFDWSVFP